MEDSRLVLFFEERRKDPQEIKRALDSHKFLLEVVKERAHLQGESLRLKKKLKEMDVIVSSLTQQLGAMERTEREMLASMSHELRTPLNAIIGFSELLLNEEYGELSLEQKRAMENIYHSGKHLLNLVNDLLELSRIERGEVKPKKELVDIGEVVKRLINITKGQTGGKRLEFFLEVDRSVGRVVTDPTLFKQITFNLLTNSAKFTPEGGRITVRIKQIGEELFLSVSDTGRGLKKEDLEKVFEPFYQIEGEEEIGLGLGLALVKRYVDILGGRVWAESEGIGMGSTFTVVIPVGTIGEEEELPVVKETHEEKRREPLAVVVEDDVPAAELLMKILTKEGYRVLWAADGVEGIEWVKEHSPDVVFLDLLLPKLDGWAFLERLKKEGIDIPVVVVSILDRDERVFELGARDFIVKPITRERISEVLAKIHSKGNNPGNPEDREKEEILVVDGNECEGIAKILKRMGFKVRIVSKNDLHRVKNSKTVVANYSDLNMFLKYWDKDG